MSYADVLFSVKIKADLEARCNCNVVSFFAAQNFGSVLVTYYGLLRRCENLREPHCE